MEKKTIVCISCYYKGYDFMDEMKQLGNNIILVTSENLKEKNWPWHAIDEVFYMPELKPSVWNLEHLIQGFSHLMKSRKVDAVVALDDYDVEKAALIRETFRIPGMGQTTHRYFRDKLAMRQKAKDSGINVPEFTAVFNDDEVNSFAERVPAPWVLKPRSEASASGIKKITSKEQLHEALNLLGEERHLFYWKVLSREMCTMLTVLPFIRKSYSLPLPNIWPLLCRFLMKVVFSGLKHWEDILKNSKHWKRSMPKYFQASDCSTELPIQNLSAEKKTENGISSKRPQGLAGLIFPIWWRPQAASISGENGPELKMLY